MYAVQSFLSIAVEFSEKPLEVNRFMASRLSALVEISTHDIGTHIRKLQTGNHFTRCKKRNIHNLSELSKRMSVLAKIQKGLPDRRLSFGVIVQN